MMSPFGTSTPIDRILRGGSKVVASSTGVSVTGAITAVTGRIAFPSTPNGTTDAYTLDDYREGTWTPTIAGTTAAGTNTYYNQYGRYIKIGSMVQIECQIYMATKDVGMTGNVDIGALPFTAYIYGATNGNGAMAVGPTASVTLDANYTQIVAAIKKNTTKISLTELKNGAAASFLTVSLIDATFQIGVGGCYIADA